MVVIFILCVVYFYRGNLAGRYHSVQFILKLMLYFQYVLNVNWQIIYLLGSNYGTVRGMILLGMTAPMTFQTVFDVLDYVLVIHAILGNYAVNIFDQAHIIPKYLFGSCIGRIKAILFVRIDHDLKTRKKKEKSDLKFPLQPMFEETRRWHESPRVAYFRTHPLLRVLSWIPSPKIHLMSWRGRLVEISEKI